MRQPRFRWLAIIGALLVVVGVYLALRPPAFPLDFLHEYDPRVGTPALWMNEISANKVRRNPHLRGPGGAETTCGQF